MEPTYNDIVAEDNKTCWGAPTQWEGTLKDGRSFYFRYRWGRAYLGVASAVDNAIWAEENGGVSAMDSLGDSLDGHLTDDEYREAFVNLYSQLA